MNEHERINQLLVDFALGELSPQVEVEVTTHLSECFRCRNMLKRLETILECTVKMKERSADDQVCESAKQAILKAVEGEKMKTTSKLNVSLEFIWRTIMESKMAKFAAAAVVVITFMLMMHRGNGSFDVSAPAFARMVKAMEKVAWVHCAWDYRPSNSVWNHRDGERWFSYPQKLMLTKRDGGTIGSLDYANHKSAVYWPDTNTMIMAYMPGEPDRMYDSPRSRVRLWKEYYDVKNADVKHEEGRYKGIDADTYYSTLYRTTNEGRRYLSSKSKLVVGRDRHLPIIHEIKSWDSKGKLVSDYVETYDYPDIGPKDIYDLGVPQSARVLDYSPTPELLKVLEAYQSHQDAAPVRYIAILRYSRAKAPSESYHVQGMEVFYSSGVLQRSDGCAIRPTPEQEFIAECGDSFDSLMQWWTCRASSEVEISHEFIWLYDEKYRYRLSRSGSGGAWSTVHESPFTTRSDMPSFVLGTQSVNRDILAELGWPSDLFRGALRRTRTSVVEDDHSKQNGLICVEMLHDGGFNTRNEVILPEKYLFYLNPERDYICQRYEIHRGLYAPWNSNPNWLDGIDPETLEKWKQIRGHGVSRGSVYHVAVTEILEYAQTNGGQWYPRKILERSISTKADGTTDEFRKMMTFYLNTDSEFPEGIFDPKRFPK